MVDVALALPLADEQRMLAEAGRHGHRVVAQCSGADELAGRVSTVRPEVAVCAATDQYLNARLVAACDAHGIRLVVVAGTAGERKFAASVGILEVVEAPVRWEQLSGRSTVDEETRSTPLERRIAPSSRGEVIAVWGPGGAPGRTSLAVAIAAEAALLGTAVALGDADTHGAAVAPALGLLDEAPGFAAACRLAGSSSLTSAEFERIAQRHRAPRGDFWVLTGIGRPSRWPELSAERVAGAIAAARDWAELTVLDTAASLEHDEELSSDLVAPRRNAATTAALLAADRVIAVGAADPVGLSRFLRGHAELLELVPPDRVTVVINKVRAGAIGLGPAAQVRQTLARFGGIDDPVLVPWDLAAFDAAVLSGRTLPEVAPRSPARVAIRSLVTERLAHDRARRAS